MREAELVLGGGWLARMVSPERVNTLLTALRERTAWVDDPPVIPALALKDEGDRRMVETAVAGGAAYIVTTGPRVPLTPRLGGRRVRNPGRIPYALG